MGMGALARDWHNLFMRFFNLGGSTFEVLENFLIVWEGWGSKNFTPYGARRGWGGGGAGKLGQVVCGPRGGSVELG